MNYKVAMDEFIYKMMLSKLKPVKNIDLTIELYEFNADGIHVHYLLKGSEDDYPFREMEVVTNSELQVYIHLLSHSTFRLL